MSHKNDNNITNKINDQQHVKNNYKELNSYQNIPIESSQSIRIPLLGQCYDGDGSGYRRQRYTRTHHVEKLAIEKYNKNGKGITFNDLLSCGIALHKKQAQTTLKHCLKRKALFTISAHKPQEYYPASLRAEILEHKISKNMPIGITGVGCSDVLHHNNNTKNNKFSNHCNESLVVIQSLEGYVLPLLSSAPLHIHKLQLKLKITRDCYAELRLATDSGNKGKEHVEIIGKVRVSYRFYANGTVMVFTESSNNPFKLEDETDLSGLMAFLGQVRDRLVTFLADTHERIVPGILEWELTQCDINKDIKVGESLQYTGLKVQVKHFDHLFRVYIKSMGNDTVCRVEESLNPKKKPAVQAINEIFSNSNDIEQQLQLEQSSSSSINDSRGKIDEIHNMVKGLFNLHKLGSSTVGQKLKRYGGLNFMPKDSPEKNDKAFDSLPVAGGTEGVTSEQQKGIKYINRNHNSENVKIIKKASPSSNLNGGDGAATNVAVGIRTSTRQSMVCYVSINGITQRINYTVDKFPERVLNELMINAILYSNYYSKPEVPEHSSWIVTMWHFGTEGITEYTGDHFSATWEVGQNALIRAYSKDMKQKGVSEQNLPRGGRGQTSTQSNEI